MIDNVPCPRCQTDIEVTNDDLNLSFLGDAKICMTIVTDCPSCDFNRGFKEYMTK